ncbi:MAG: hypothetical protein PHP52_14135 [Bacteroidales bacterium]|nr:hypothetical protein [Bacteroidales bacterium]
MKVNRGNTLLLTVISVATLLVAVIGATFAYFTATITNGEDNTTITVGAGKLEIVYASGDGDINNIQEALDIKPEENKAALTKNFTITGSNSTESVIPYSLQLVVTENEFSDNALSYTLASTNTGVDGVANGAVAQPIEETGILNLNEPEEIVEPRFIGIGEGYFAGDITDAVHTYVLNIFFQETHIIQDPDKDKEFGAYVNVIPGSAYTTTTES